MLHGKVSHRFPLMSALVVTSTGHCNTLVYKNECPLNGDNLSCLNYMGLVSHVMFQTTSVMLDRQNRKQKPKIS